MPKYEDSDDYRKRLLAQQEAANAPRDFSGVARLRFAWAQHVIVDRHIKRLRRAALELGFIYGATFMAVILPTIIGLILWLGNR